MVSDHEQFRAFLSSIKEKQNRDSMQIMSAIEKLNGRINQMQEAFNQVLEVLPYLSQRSVQTSNTSSLPHQAESSESSRLQLLFKGELPDTLLTKNNIEEEGASLTVELCDHTGKRVEVGPESYLNDLMVEFLVLDGDFEVEKRNDWTKDDFKKYVVTPRKDKGELLKGRCEVSLSEGLATVSGFSFTDNSSPMRSRMFRLGAQVTKDLPSGLIIQPGVSQAVRVKENRLKADQKQANPLPTAKLYRLKNINKTGAYYRRAEKSKVFTVMDFLQFYHTDAEELKAILAMPEKKWNETVKNATACNLSNERYKYRYHDDELGDELLLKCDFKIESVAFKDQISQPYDSLDISQKEKVRQLRKDAYNKRKVLIKEYETTNWTPSHAGLACPHIVEQQPTAVPPPSNMDPNVVDVASLHDQTTSNLSENFLRSTAAGHGMYTDNGQQYNMDASSMFTGECEVHNTDMGVGNSSSAVYEFPTENVADDEIDSHQFQGEMNMQQMFDDPLPNPMPSQILNYLFNLPDDSGCEDFTVDDLLNFTDNGQEQTHEEVNKNPSKSCKLWLVPLVVCRWKRRKAIHSRPQKRQKT